MTELEIYSQYYIERPHPASLQGKQRLYRFDNGYGASLVNFKLDPPPGMSHSSTILYGSYTTTDEEWELAPIIFTGPTIEEFELCFDICDIGDPIGHLLPEQVEPILKKIKDINLPKVRTAQEFVDKWS